jgi:hypothetical protein
LQARYGSEHFRSVYPAKLRKSDTSGTIEDYQCRHSPHTKTLSEDTTLFGINIHPHDQRHASQVTLDPVNDRLGQQACASKVRIKGNNRWFALGK